MLFLEMRAPGYKMLKGTGIEIGGFEHPAVLPQAKRIIRCDRITREEAHKLFPEVDIGRLPQVDVQIDLDQTGLQEFKTGSLDFVVCCHVIEHLKNPIKALSELFRVVKNGGHLAIAIPDKHCTFDKNRPETDWTKLEDIYRKDINTPVPEDYIDMVHYIHTKLIGLPPDQLAPHLNRFMQRREHLNIWSSSSFRAFLEHSLDLIGLQGRLMYEVTAEKNEFEYFCIIKKQRTNPIVKFIQQKRGTYQNLLPLKAKSA